MSFQVSVIIPVYNAANFVRDAVISANNLEEVGEIILIEDCSPDNALEVCQQLYVEFEKVRLFTHPNNENRGPGASRNLGILYAKYEYISFLDADDYYLPNRFTTTKQVFAGNPDCDGVYEATSRVNYRNEDIEFITIIKNIPPDKLFRIMVQGFFGFFHTNSITFKRYIFEKHLFNTKLYLHQDTELWYRLAYHFKFLPGNIKEATNIVRRHKNNRITHRSLDSHKLLLKEVFAYFSNISILKRSDKIALNYLLYIVYFENRNNFTKYFSFGFYQFINYTFSNFLFKFNNNFIKNDFKFK